MVDGDHETPPAEFGEACAAIARAIADSLDLEQVVARIAAAGLSTKMNPAISRAGTR